MAQYASDRPVLVNLATELVVAHSLDKATQALALAVVLRDVRGTWRRLTLHRERIIRSPVATIGADISNFPTNESGLCWAEENFRIWHHVRITVPDRM